MTEKQDGVKFPLLPKKAVIVLIAAATVILLIIIGFITGYAFADDNIYKGVKIAGIDVGGMNKDSAVAAVNDYIDKKLSKNEITFVYEDDKQAYSSNELITAYKVDEAVENACNAGRNGNVFSNFFSYYGIKFKGMDIPLEPALEDAFIEEFMNEYANKLDTPLAENTYEVENNKLRLINGAPGMVIDRARAVEELKTALMNGKSTVITVEKTQKNPTPFNVDAIHEDVCIPPTNANIETREGKKYIVEAKNGYNFKKEDLQKLIDDNKASDKPYYLDLEIIEPSVKQVNTDGLFNEVLSTFTTKITDSNAARLTNVRLATEKINGSVLNPGDVFYYLRHVEPITPANGYKIANVYNNGKIEQDIGGGVCQVSSALYSAVLYADLGVVKRYNHSLTVGYVPLGMDATVSSGEGDFRFKNTTNAPLKIRAVYSPSAVVITLLGEKVDKGLTVEIENITIDTLTPKEEITEDPSMPEGERAVEYAGKKGYIVETYKKYYRDGQLVERKFISKSTYRAAAKRIRVGTGAAKSTVSEVTAPPVTPQPTPTPTPAAPVSDIPVQTAPPTSPASETPAE